MKKLLLLLFTVLSVSFAKAEDVIQVVPFSTTAGVTSWTKIPVDMVNSGSLTAFELSIYVPEGMSIYPASAAQNKDRKCLSDRFTFIDPDFGDEIQPHQLTITDRGSVVDKGHWYYITCWDEDFHEIKGNSGTLFYLMYKTDSNMKPGVYPIRIEDTIMGSKDETGIHGTKPATSVSFVTIKDSEGNVPANGMYNLGDNLVPSFVQSTLPANNVIINGMCENLVLTDGADFSLPCNFTATNATYSRAMDTEWGTVCLPYEVKSNDQVEYYNITGIEGNVLTLDKLNTLSANTPALMKKLSGTGVTCSASNVGVMSTGLLSGMMVGSYAQNTKITNEDAYYIYDNKFWKNNGHFFIDAFRAYFKASTTGAKPSQLNIGEIYTAINALTSEEGVVGVYDANGVKKGSVGNGMNIIKMADGKCVKVFVK